MLRPLNHIDKIVGNTELEDFVYRARKALIANNQRFGFKAIYFDQLTELRRLIEENRPRSVTRVSFYDLFSPDAELISWLEQPKVQFLFSLITFHFFLIFIPFSPRSVVKLRVLKLSKTLPRLL